MNDFFRDQWVEYNIPRAEHLSRDLVVDLVKRAYEEGREAERRKQTEDVFEKTHGPRFI